MRKLTLFALLFAAACTDDTSTLGDAQSGVDAVSHADAAVNMDATGFPDAAGNMDATGFPDAAGFMDAIGFPDAENMDAENMDAENMDAEETDLGDAGFQCTDLGMACSPTMACTNNHMCSSPGDVCIPESPPGCGGFANQQCPAGLLCTYYIGADYGACFDAATQACICVQPAGSAAFVCP